MVQQTRERSNVAIEKRPWLLLVDDDVVSGRSTARCIAAKTRTSVVVAQSLTAASRQVKASFTWPAAVVLDYELAGPSGVRVLAALRKLGCNAPCAFLTGAPEKVQLALRRSRRDESIRIFSRAEPTEKVTHWLAELGINGEATSPDSPELLKGNQLQLGFYHASSTRH